MRKDPGGKREIRLHKIHCGIQYAWILGECGLVVPEMRLVDSTFWKSLSRIGLIAGVGNLF